MDLFHLRLSLVFSKRFLNKFRHKGKKSAGSDIWYGQDTSCLHKADNKEILSTFFVLLHVFLQCHHPVVNGQVKDHSTRSALEKLM